MRENIQVIRVFVVVINVFLRFFFCHCLRADPGGCNPFLRTKWKDLSSCSASTKQNSTANHSITLSGFLYSKRSSFLASPTPLSRPQQTQLFLSLSRATCNTLTVHPQSITMRQQTLHLSSLSLSSFLLKLFWLIYK